MVHYEDDQRYFTLNEAALEQRDATLEQRTQIPETFRRAMVYGKRGIYCKCDNFVSISYERKVVEKIRSQLAAPILALTH